MMNEGWSCDFSVFLTAEIFPQAGFTFILSRKNRIKWIYFSFFAAHFLLINLMLDVNPLFCDLIKFCICFSDSLNQTF